MFVMNGIVIAALTSSHRLILMYPYLYAITVLTLEFTISFRFYRQCCVIYLIRIALV